MNYPKKIDLFFIFIFFLFAYFTPSSILSRKYEYWQFLPPTPLCTVNVDTLLKVTRNMGLADQIIAGEEISESNCGNPVTSGRT